MKNKHPSDPETSPILGFQSYERLLWHMLVLLGRRGYFVPPDEARDVVHDFYLDAWRGLVTRYDADVGGFPAYLAGAFYRFARRRLIDMSSLRLRLVDLDEVLEHAYEGPSPVDLAQSAQEAKRVRVALESLPGEQRQVLHEYATAEHPSERYIAARHGTSRYAVRRALADGMSNLGIAYARVGLPKLDAKMAELAWSDALPSHHISHELRVSTRAVQDKRKAMAETLVFAIRESSEVALGGAQTMQLEAILKKYLFDSDSTAAENFLHRHVEQIRSELPSFNGADVHFTVAEMERLNAHPERLGTFYELVFPDELAQEHSGEISEVVAKFARDDRRMVTEAFEELARGLGNGLNRWNEWFAEPDLPSGYLRDAERQALEAGAGGFVLGLLPYGLKPETFAEVFAGFSLLFSAKLNDEPRGRPSKSSFPIWLKGKSATVPVLWDEIFMYAEETPGLPEGTDAARRLSTWTVRALRQRPMLFSEFYMKADAGDVLLLEPAPPSQMELMARWSHRAYEHHFEQNQEGFTGGMSI